VESILGELRPRAMPQAGAGAGAGFHPGRSATWRDADGTGLAWAGALHPSLQERLSQPCFLAELDLDLACRFRAGVPQYAPLPRRTPVTRDLALVLPQELTFGGVLEVLRGVEAPAAVDFRAVDRYEGAPLAEGHASLTVRVTLHPLDRTLTEAEIEAYRNALVASLGHNLGLTLRD
jgi:phenylalanyl-tRNA synthetase beta chain